MQLLHQGFAVSHLVWNKNFSSKASQTMISRQTQMLHSKHSSSTFTAHHLPRKRSLHLQPQSLLPHRFPSRRGSPPLIIFPLQPRRVSLPLLNRGIFLPRPNHVPQSRNLFPLLHVLLPFRIVRPHHRSVFPIGLSQSHVPRHRRLVASCPLQVRHPRREMRCLAEQQA